MNDESGRSAGGEPGAVPGRSAGLRIGALAGSLLVAGFALSMWLRAGFPPLAAMAPHDDLLFVRLAEEIAAGRWLGGFDQLTLVKGSGYPLFLAAVDLLGLPAKPSEHFLYLAASLSAVATIAYLCAAPRLVVPAFWVLALNPYAWGKDAARVVRENVYQSEGLALFALTALYLYGGGRRRALGVALGSLAGVYWITREEGVWLLPALLVPTLAAAVAALRGGHGPRGRELLRSGGRMALPVGLAFAGVVGAVNLANWEHYGVFRNNDFRAGPFVAAYGAVSRIKAEAWTRYVVFPRDARIAAYRVSPAAAELGRYFEGQPGRDWAAVSRGYPPPWGCPAGPPGCNREILSGWFMWALRDAVSQAGHYRSARDADRYYLRLAGELDAACDAGRIACEAPRATMLPVWRDRYLADIGRAGLAIAGTLAALPVEVGVPPSILPPELRRRFEALLNQPVSPPDLPGAAAGTGRAGDDARLNLARGIAEVYRSALAPLFLVALLASLLTGVRRPGSAAAAPAMPMGVLLAALLVACASRLALLAILEATSIPSDNLLYLSPMLPFYLLFIVCALHAGAAHLGVRRSA